MSTIAAQLASDGAPVRLKVIDTGTTVESARQFAAGKVDLAVVRDAATLNVVAHRLENLIQDRREMLLKKPQIASVA
jgi:TRAP-type uncharacterized transport system substrate-binding protein